MPLLRSQIATDIGIDSPAERVWDILTDFGSYPDWNPFMAQVEGEPSLGSRLSVRWEPGARPAFSFDPRIIEFEPPTTLIWQGRLFVPWVFDVRHSFVVEDLAGGGAHFKQSAAFRGVLVPFRGHTLRDTERGFRAMNHALARRSEQGGGERPRAGSPF